MTGIKDRTQYLPELPDDMVRLVAQTNIKHSSPGELDSILPALNSASKVLHDEISREPVVPIDTLLKLKNPEAIDVALRSYLSRGQESTDKQLLQSPRVVGWARRTQGRGPVHSSNTQRWMDLPSSKTLAILTHHLSAKGIESLEAHAQGPKVTTAAEFAELARQGPWEKLKVALGQTRPDTGWKLGDAMRAAAEAGQLACLQFLTACSPFFKFGEELAIPFAAAKSGSLQCFEFALEHCAQLVKTGIRPQEMTARSTNELCAEAIATFGERGLQSVVSAFPQDVERYLPAFASSYFEKRARLNTDLRAARGEVQAATNEASRATAAAAVQHLSTQRQNMAEAWRDVNTQFVDSLDNANFEGLLTHLAESADIDSLDAFDELIPRIKTFNLDQAKSVISQLSPQITTQAAADALFKPIFSALLSDKKLAERIAAVADAQQRAAERLDSLAFGALEEVAPGSRASQIDVLTRLVRSRSSPQALGVNLQLFGLSPSSAL